jgi:hypothetical protein
MPVERVTARLALFVDSSAMLLATITLSFGAGSLRQRREQQRKPSERGTDMMKMLRVIYPDSTRPGEV